MLNLTASQLVDSILSNPINLARQLGFDKLTPLHNAWISHFIAGQDDFTLLAHRGSFKTTCVSIAIASIMLLLPNKSILFMRKTDDDVKEIIEQVRKILSSNTFSNIAAAIFCSPIKLLKTNANEITTNLVTRPTGNVQLMGMGIKTSLTGKHFDIIFTDDIVNLKDRQSRAEREHTKQIYMELQNIKNRGGRIINTGTPWHKDDCISLMPNVTLCDCYSSSLIPRHELDVIRNKTAPSLFSANYELIHIASELALFTSPPHFADNPALLYNGFAHIDAAYGGSDASALTLGKRSVTSDGNTVIFLLGKLRRTHIDNCLDEFLTIKNFYRCGSILVEENADKGYLKKEIRRRANLSAGYFESMNKYIKIAAYLKKWWNNIVFLHDTDPDYISQIMNYSEDAEHDDAPDSAASLIMRKLDKPKRISLV